MRRQHSPHRKHWWHTSLLPTARGLTTGPVAAGAGSVELELAFRAGELRLVADDGRERRISLASDPAGAGRDEFVAALHELDITAELPGFEHPTAPGYDAAAAGRYLQGLLAVASALRQLQAELPGETSPVQLWPHHFDLALTWFSGRAVAGKEKEPPDERDESITVGFSTGDGGDPDPYLYALAHPWPVGAEHRRLAAGRWHGAGWDGGFLPWSEAVATGDPQAATLAFTRAAMRALTRAQGALAAAPPQAR